MKLPLIKVFANMKFHFNRSDSVDQEKSSRNESVTLAAANTAAATVADTDDGHSDPYVSVLC